MRFAGCCNISCKRIDAVEHSDDLGASRKGRNLPTSEKQSTLEKIASPLRRGSKKLQQSNAPGPKDLSRQTRLATLRVCDRVADKKDLAKQWAEALAAGAEKQQPLGGYRGEDVAAKNPFTKALAARGRLAVAS